MKRGLMAVADLILPRTCVVCGRKLLLREDVLCLYCRSDIPFTRFRQLKHNPMADRLNEVIQKQLDEIPGPLHENYAYALSLFFFDTESSYRHIPYQIKYHGNIQAGKHFGEMLGHEIIRTRWMSDVDAIIPVPLHWRRKWSRGYNQAEVIARAAAEIVDVPMRTDILIRRRFTKTQTKMDVPQKAKNVNGAFEAKAPEYDGIRHILLIDDVFTSGNTIGACFRALRMVFPPHVRISVATLCFVGR